MNLSKARLRPSGEKAGSTSPSVPLGGEGSCRFSPVSTESRNMEEGTSIEFESEVASHLLLGCQDSFQQYGFGRSATCRSLPKLVRIIITPIYPCPNSPRRAMDRPSGAHAGDPS